MHSHLKEHLVISPGDNSVSNLKSVWKTTISFTLKQLDSLLHSWLSYRGISFCIYIYMHTLTPLYRRQHRTWASHYHHPNISVHIRRGRVGTCEVKRNRRLFLLMIYSVGIQISRVLLLSWSQWTLIMICAAFGQALNSNCPSSSVTNQRYTAQSTLLFTHMRRDKW